MYHFDTLYLRSYDTSTHRAGEWEMCPAGQDTSSVDHAVLYHSKPFEMPNDPVKGHKLGELLRYRTSDEYAVIDPRGFKLGISLDNLMGLIRDCKIINGVIQNECVWMYSNRRGPFLCPMHSKFFLDSARIQYLKSNRVSLRDVNRGDHVLLQNGQQVQYLGLWRYCRYGKVRDPFPSWTLRLNNPAKGYLYIGTDKAGRDYLDQVSSLTISEIVQRNPLTEEEVQDLVYAMPSPPSEWNLRHAAYMAPCKFKLTDLRIEKVPYDPNQISIDKRPLLYTEESGILWLSDLRMNRRSGSSRILSTNSPCIWNEMLSLNIEADNFAVFKDDRTLGTTSAYIPSPTSKVPASMFEVSIEKKGKRLFKQILTGILPNM